METENKEYYGKMKELGRSVVFIVEGRLRAVLTYWVGDDDKKFLTDHEPWTLLEDDPNGTTIYIDQLLTKPNRENARIIHRWFTKTLQELKRDKYPNITRAKWIRVGAGFRKHKSLEGVKNVIQTKSIK